jgi:hypothetical protein
MKVFYCILINYVYIKYFIALPTSYTLPNFNGSILSLSVSSSQSVVYHLMTTVCSRNTVNHENYIYI